jgi:hypothetical protein
VSASNRTTFRVEMVPGRAGCCHTVAGARTNARTSGEWGIEVDGHRLSDKADARRLLREQPKQHHSGHVAKADQVDAPSGAGSAELIGDAGHIELDPAEIAAAQAELDRRHEELTTLLTHAGELETPLRDGSGPVSVHLRKAFGLRGSADSGVQAILRDYLDELAALRDAIRQAADAHQRNEADAGDALATIKADTGTGARG